MSEAPQQVVGARLTVDEYIADFEPRFWRTEPVGGWKLERQQTFREPGNESWEASDDGDWERSKDLLERDRAGAREYQQSILDHGFEFHRVRVVEKPYSPYLIWELNCLLIRHQYGERIRIIPADAVNELERHRHLPEIVVLGDEVVYEVHYDETGAAAGATRSTDPHTIRHWRELIRDLHARGENLPDFFAREIADLAPARTG
jgi:hypothetical protein